MFNDNMFNVAAVGSQAHAHSLTQTSLRRQFCTDHSNGKEDAAQASALYKVHASPACQRIAYLCMTVGNAWLGA